MRKKILLIMTTVSFSCVSAISNFSINPGDVVKIYSVDSTDPEDNELTFSLKVTSILCGGYSKIYSLGSRPTGVTSSNITSSDISSGHYKYAHQSKKLNKLTVVNFDSSDTSGCSTSTAGNLPEGDYHLTILAKETHLNNPLSSRNISTVTITIETP